MGDAGKQTNSDGLGTRQQLALEVLPFGVSAFDSELGRQRFDAGLGSAEAHGDLE